MFYLIDKKQGLSSFQAIKEFARKHHINKVGHTGTLDPLATGLLLVATDADTKLISYVDQGFKRYRATMIFNQVADTYDITGKISYLEFKEITKANFKKVLKTFEGTTKQNPPVFSAKKVQGQRAYKLARNQKEVILKPINIVCKDFKIIDFNNQEATFEVSVSRGTYIRSLINDIGQKLGSGALMSALRRIKIGPLDETYLNQKIDITPLLIYPTLELLDIKLLKEGKVMFLKHQDGVFSLKYKDEIIGIGEIKNNYLKTRKLLGNKI